MELAPELPFVFGECVSKEALVTRVLCLLGRVVFMKNLLLEARDPKPQSFRRKGVTGPKRKDKKGSVHGRKDRKEVDIEEVDT